jgi:hypothetical protein
MKLRAKEEEAIFSEKDYKKLSAEHENLKRDLKMYESSDTNKFEVLRKLWQS